MALPSTEGVLPRTLEPCKTNILLPFGNTTLHYDGCGCPAAWAPGTRACDLVDSCVQQAFMRVQHGLMTPLRKLRVLFCLPHHNVTGGMKMLVEQIRLLRERGHYVVAVMRSETAQSAMPPWTDVRADADVVCRLAQCMDEVCDVHAVDAVVVGIFHQVAEWLLTSAAPVLYWEQGHEWLFGDPVRMQEAHNYGRQDVLFHRAMHLPCALGAVSRAVQNVLTQEFGRTSLLIHNGIDCGWFVPGPRSTRAPTKVLTAANYEEAGSAAAEARRSKPSVLLCGNPSLPLKGFDVALAVLSLVNQVYPLEVTWVCQQEPSEQQLPTLPSCGLRINLHISPPQDVLPSLYRGHDCFLFTSRYEAWGMPVLEAMASGLAVVTTNCLGVTSFAQPGVNCFMAAPQDVMGLARGVLHVLAHPTIKHHMQATARATAELFSPESVASQVETVLYSLSSCSQELLTLRHGAATDIQLTSMWAAFACTKNQELQEYQRSPLTPQPTALQEQLESAPPPEASAPCIVVQKQGGEAATPESHNAQRPPPQWPSKDVSSSTGMRLALGTCQGSAGGKAGQEGCALHSWNAAPASHAGEQ